MHEGQFKVERLLDGQQMFRRPDGSTIEPLIEPVSAGGEYTSTLAPLPAADGESWSGCGDSMDYAIVLHNIHCLDRTGSPVC